MKRPWWADREVAFILIVWAAGSALIVTAVFGAAGRSIFG